jgi:hypothetical protein
MTVPPFLAIAFPTGLIVAIAALVLAIFWMFQFVQLMLLEDGYFAGRYDKILWVITFLVMPLLAPFAFLMWKGAKSSNRQS